MTAPNLVGGGTDPERRTCAVEGCTGEAVADFYTLDDGGDPEPRCYECLEYDLGMNAADD